MTAFKYISIDKNGHHYKGVIEADTPRQARELLRQKHLTPLDLQEVTGASGKVYKSTGRKQPNIGLRELRFVTRQLAILIESSLPVERALQIVSNQKQSSTVGHILAAVRSYILEGHGLADAMDLFPASFPLFFRNSIRASEKTGHLDKTLLFLADYLDKTYLYRQKILTAMVYPAILITVSFSMVIFLTVFIMPGLVRVFSDTGHTLPLLTRALIVLSNIATHYGILIIGILLGLFLLLKRLFQIHRFRIWCDTYVLALPIIGKLINQHNAVRFSSTLAMLQESGVPLVQALETSRNVVHNQHIRKDLETVTLRVGEGIPLSSALERESSLPSILATMCASGEATGKLGEVLRRCSDAIQQDVERQTVMLIGLLEPMVLLLMGGIVLALVLAIILPIMQLNQLV